MARRDMPAVPADGQVVIAFRETDQTLVTTATDYLAHCKTKYRNWRLYGTAAFIELPVCCALLVGPGSARS